MTRDKESDDGPTELEAATLGAVWKHGPCTAYSIRQQFLQSPSQRWSGSAGAIYPLIRRLEKRGLVGATANARGKRRQVDYELTRLGRTVLRRWVRQPIPQPATELLHDPLRTRVLFLDVLTTSQARTFLDNAVTAVRHQLISIRKNCKDKPVETSPFEHFAARNALLITEARVKWLEEVRAGIDAL